MPVVALAIAIPAQRHSLPAFIRGFDMRLKAWALFVAVIACAPMAAAQQSDEDDIVVTAPVIEEAARTFAREVSAPPSREDQLARFENRVCPGVVGLGQRQAQFMVDRIAQRALEIDLEVGRPGCKANVLVLVTADGASAARSIVEEQEYLMASDNLRENLNTRGDDALQDFIATSRPVRWWHVAQTETTDGDVLGHTNPYGRTRSTNMQEFRGAEVTRPSGSNFGRLSRRTLQAMRNVVVIIDTQRVGDVRLDALADYVAMVALAQTEPGADTAGYDTILNLFSETRDGQSGMTEWDLAYLQGLYTGRGNALDSTWQSRTIARRMRDDLTSER